MEYVCTSLLFFAVYLGYFLLHVWSAFVKPHFYPTEPNCLKYCNAKSQTARQQLVGEPMEKCAEGGRKNWGRVRVARFGEFL